jgi:hypothetical protein
MGPERKPVPCFVRKLILLPLPPLLVVGVVVVRNTPQAMAFMDSWQEAMAPGSPSKSAEGWWIDDQLALTQLLDDSSLPFQGDCSIQPLCSTQHIMTTLAAKLGNGCVCSAHSMYVQQSGSCVQPPCVKPRVSRMASSTDAFGGSPWQSTTGLVPFSGRRC